MLSVRSLTSAVVGVIAGGLLMPVAAQAEYNDTTLLHTVINNGRPIVMGAGAQDFVTVPVEVEIREDSGGLATVEARLEGSGGGYMLTFLEDADDDKNDMTCTPNGPAGDSSTPPSAPAGSGTLTCRGTAIVHQYDIYASMIGQKVSLRILGYAYDSGRYDLRNDPAHTVTVLTRSVLATANATPEPVRKGGTLTVTGRLTQPDRSLGYPEGYAMAGYAEQRVQLQFKKAGATAYSTIKTATSAFDGKLKTTVAAGATGTWRWSYAGSGTAAASVSTEDGVTLLKAAKLTANAAPEPVRKGGQLTVTGRLTRATTDAATSYVAYGSQPVKLQFRKTGSSTYTTVKTVRTSAAGYLKTTTKAKSKGYWRWTYAGSATVASVSAAGDRVALK